MPEAPFVRKPLAGRPGTHHHGESFLEASLGFLRRKLKALEFAVAIAFADAKIEPACGEEIERGSLLRKQYRIMPGEHDDGCAKPQCGCSHCKRSKQHQRGGNLIPPAEMMFDRKA